MARTLRLGRTNIRSDMEQSLKNVLQRFPKSFVQKPIVRKKSRGVTVDISFDEGNLLGNVAIHF